MAVSTVQGLGLRVYGTEPVCRVIKIEDIVEGRQVPARAGKPQIIVKA